MGALLHIQSKQQREPPRRQLRPSSWKMLMRLGAAQRVVRLAVARVRPIEALDNLVGFETVENAGDVLAYPPGKAA